MEGVLGISYALFLGGAHSILVTLYPVEDEVAAQFSLSFYRNLHKSKSRRGAFALTKAELADRYSQKALAAFQLMGSGDELLETYLSRLVRFGRSWTRKHKK
jgi:CHAT domain-containing protein